MYGSSSLENDCNWRKGVITEVHACAPLHMCKSVHPGEIHDDYAVTVMAVVSPSKLSSIVFPSLENILYLQHPLYFIIITNTKKS